MSSHRSACLGVPNRCADHVSAIRPLRDLESSLGHYKRSSSLPEDKLWNNSMIKGSLGSKDGTSSCWERPWYRNATKRDAQVHSSGLRMSDVNKEYLSGHT